MAYATDNELLPKAKELTDKVVSAAQKVDESYGITSSLDESLKVRGRPGAQGADQSPAMPHSTPCWRGAQISDKWAQASEKVSEVTSQAKTKVEELSSSLK